MIGLMLNYYKNMLHWTSNIFLKSCEDGNIDVVKKFIDNPKCFHYKSKAMNLASKNNHINIVKLLLEDKNVNPSDALISAISSNNIEETKLLLCDDRIIDLLSKKVDFDHIKCLEKTIVNGNYDMVDLLIKDTNYNSVFSQSDPINAACYGRHIDIVKLLMNYKIKDKRNTSIKIVHRAISMQEIEIAHLMLDYLREELNEYNDEEEDYDHFNTVGY